MTRRCAFATASRKTRPLSCSERVVPLNFAYGACGRVRCANSSKSSASSKNVTVPGSGVQCSSLSQRSRSAKKGISHCHSTFLGVRKRSNPLSSGLGRGPTSWWYGYCRSCCERLDPLKSMGDCVSRNLRACKTATNILCRAVKKASAVPDLTLSGSNSGANPQSRKHGDHWSMRGRPGTCAAAVLMPGRWVSRTALQAGHCQKMCSSVSGALPQYGHVDVALMPR